MTWTLLAVKLFLAVLFIQAQVVLLMHNMSFQMDIKEEITNQEGCPTKYKQMPAAYKQVQQEVNLQHKLRQIHRLPTITTHQHQLQPPTLIRDLSTDLKCHLLVFQNLFMGPPQLHL